MNIEQIKFLLLIGMTILVWGGVFLGMSTCIQIAINQVRFILKKRKEKPKTSKELEEENEEHNERLRRSRLIDGKFLLSLNDIPKSNYCAEIKCNNCGFYQEFSSHFQVQDCRLFLPAKED